MKLKRRAFLQAAASTAALGYLTPGFTYAQSTATGPIKNFIHVFLYGGADGRVMYPYTGGDVGTALRALRPNVTPIDTAILSLSGMNQSGRSNTLGFHPAFAPLLSKLEETQCGMTVLTEYGVTANNNFSHDVATGHFLAGTNRSSQTLTQGWLGKLIDAATMQSKSVWGIGEDSSFFLNSFTEKPIVVNSLNAIVNYSRNFGTLTCASCAPVGTSERTTTFAEDNAFAQHISRELQKEAHPEIALDDAMRKTQDSIRPTIDTVSAIKEVTIDANLFGAGNNISIKNSLIDIARTIYHLNSATAPGGLQNTAKIFATGFSGWDAHYSLSGTYNTLITRTASALAGLVHYLKLWNLLNSTVILVHTEFGRTLRQNASYGLDHAAGNHVAIIGGKVKRAVIGPEATIEELNSQNYFTPKVPFTSVLRKILTAQGFSNSILDEVFKDHLPGEMDLPFLI